MNQETYENLMRVAEKRLFQARLTGDRKALSDAAQTKARLQDEMARFGGGEGRE